MMTVKDVYDATTIFQPLKIRDNGKETIISGYTRLDSDLAMRCVAFIEAKDGYLVVTVIEEDRHEGKL